MRHVRVLTTLAGVVLALSACGTGDGDSGSGTKADPFEGLTAEAAPDFKDKWIKSDDTQSQGFNDITSMDKVFDDMLKPEGKLQIVPGKEVDGKQTVGLKDGAATDGKASDKGILYISKEGPA